MKIQDQVIEDKGLPIPGYEGFYTVTRDGIVYPVKRSGSSGKPLTRQVDRGYFRVMLARAGKNKNSLVHRLVAETYIPREKGKYVVNHKDGNRQNNTVENLEWCTRAENERHKIEVLGSNVRGNKNPNFKRGKGLLYPTYEQAERLVKLGVPRWAIRLDWLGVMLPEVVDLKTWGRRYLQCLHFPQPNLGYVCRLVEVFGGYVPTVIMQGDTEAQARAAMLIYLLENNHITADEVNQRLTQ